MSEIAVSVFSDTVCELGEGPTYDQGSQTLFWFDILGRKLLSRAFDQSGTVVHDLPVMASALAVIDDDRQLLMTETGLHIRETATGRLTLQTPIEADNAATRSNDCRVHPSGAFWVSTMGKKAEAKAGAIYWYCGNSLRKLFSEISIPNSICFSPDGAVAYFTDSRINRLMRVDCDPATGLPKGEPSLFFDNSQGEGELDGSIVDADGVLWNARWGSASLDAYSPVGNRIRSVPLTAGQSSCPAFFGPKADRIVVTSALQGMSAKERAAEPQGGMTFLVDLAVSGRHEPRVKL